MQQLIKEHTNMQNYIRNKQTKQTNKQHKQNKTYFSDWARL